MSDEFQNTVGSTYSIEELTDKDLKSPTSLTQSERLFLSDRPRSWYNHLVSLKKRTEYQLTSSNARRFSLYHSYVAGTIDKSQYFNKLQEEKTWKCNAARFVQQIEIRLSEVKTLMQ